MDDLFGMPSDDPFRVARALDRLGDISRLRMKKGKDYMTWEHRGAKIVRLWASGGSSPRVVETAKNLLSEAKLELNRANNTSAWLAVVAGIGWGIVCSCLFI